jgi:hypothetical protein
VVWPHGEHHLVDSACFYPGEEARDVEIFRADAVECRKPAAEHMVTTGKQARAVECPDVGDFLHHAQGARIAARVGADAAGVACVDIAADVALDQRLGDAGKRLEQGGQRRLAVLDQPQHRAPRGSRAQTRQTGERGTEGFDFL